MFNHTTLMVLLDCKTKEQTTQCECLTVTANEANCFESIRDTLLLPANEFSVWTTLHMQSLYIEDLT